MADVDASRINMPAGGGGGAYNVFAVSPGLEPPYPPSAPPPTFPGPSSGLPGGTLGPDGRIVLPGLTPPLTPQGQGAIRPFGGIDFGLPGTHSGGTSFYPNGPPTTTLPPAWQGEAGGPNGYLPGTGKMIIPEVGESLPKPQQNQFGNGAFPWLILGLTYYQWVQREIQRGIARGIQQQQQSSGDARAIESYLEQQRRITEAMRGWVPGRGSSVP